MRLLITLLGAGIGIGLASIFSPVLQRFYPALIPLAYLPLVLYGVLGILGGLFFFLISNWIIQHTLRLIGAVERRWDKMPSRQIMLSTIGLILGLAVAALISQLILSAGPSLFTISASALVYVVMGTIGVQIGFRRYRDERLFSRRIRRKMQSAVAAEELMGADAFFLGEEEEESEPSVMEASGQPYSLRKFLDTSVIIDGRILDIVKTGFLEGEIVIPQFVLVELRHIADSGDSLRRARGRRGLDVLSKLQKELKNTVLVDETDFEDVAEVDVKLLRLCREKGGAVVTNDYNLNKVASVTGIKVLNINDLANAVKPMLMAGEELTVQIMREGKEPGQGVAYLDDGTMIVVDNGRRYVGESVTVAVTTVLQTSAGRMIFTKLKNADEKAG
ncbi:MAG: TRAM domain-containing protein [Clostridiales bacterium]|nr:TRAM domain-containing protein [Clostridiales bacterium]